MDSHDVFFRSADASTLVILRGAGALQESEEFGHWGSSGVSNFCRGILKVT
jgi:hypothetical protein